MGEVTTIIRPGVAQIRASLRNAADVEPVFDLKYLVKDWLSEGALSVLYGPSNAGKTFVALSLSGHVAAGTAWFGCRVEQRNVLYLALEGGVGFTNRVAAVKQQLPMLCATRGLTLLNAPLDLYQSQGVPDLVEAISPKRFGLIVIDTLARAIAGADENTAKDMGQFVGNLDRLRETTGAHVMVVHHSGKAEEAGARGSSALRAAVDTELSLSSEHELKATKQRDMVAAAPIYLDLETVTLGVDAEGDEVTSAVIAKADPPKSERMPLTGKAEVAMQALLDALRDHGETRTGSAYPTNRKVVHVDRYREACDAHGLTSGVSESAARQAFKRANDKLTESNEIRQYGDYVWKVQNDEC